jgi:hypothetical protein
MKNFTVNVDVLVDVSIDETKFTPEFMEEFRKSFYAFDTIEEHVAHIGELAATGRIAGWNNDFIEGYGKLDEMGIKVSVLCADADVTLEQDS